MTTQKLILSIFSGLAACLTIGAFLYYDYTLAAIILVLGLLLGVIVYLVRVNTKVMSLMADREKQLYNRNMYLTDVLMRQEPSLAHAINQVPPPISDNNPKEGFMDFAGMEGVRYEEVK
jgi:hypothetical protein